MKEEEDKKRRLLAKKRDDKMREAKLNAAKLENIKLADKLKRESYQAAKEMTEATKENDPELNDFNLLSRGVYLLPEWPDNVKYNY